MTSTTCLDCGRVIRKPASRCVDCRRAKDKLRGTSKERGYGAEWRKMRDLVLAQEKCCARCGCEGSPGNPLSVDHIIPKARGGTNDRDNLQTLCHKCNSGKRDR
jgi:5-methylcytosine-specific restriction protein A